MNLRKAAIIYSLGKYSKTIIQILVTIILARILTPYDYGVVAIVTVFSSLFAAFSDMGFGVAIVQKRWLTNSQINDIFSFTFYFSLIISIFFGFSSFFIASFYKDKVYISLVWLLSISLFFNSFNMVPNGIMNRKQLFSKIAWRTVISYLVSAIVAILLALFHFRYYAIVIQGILAAMITFFWNLNNSNLHLKLNFNINSVKAVFSYSGYQFAFNIINYVAENLDNLLSGKFFGSKKLGLYNKAYSLTLYPVDNLVGVITPVLHPILAKYQDSKEIIYDKYLRVYKFLFVIGIFTSVYCFLASKELILLFFGNQWVNAIPCFHVLSLVMFTRILNSSCGAIFQALNNTRLLFINGLLNTVITVIAILVGVFVGGNIANLAICVSISYIIQYLTAFYMLIEMAFKFRIGKFLRETYKYYVVIIIMIIVSYLYPFHIAQLFLSAFVKLIYVTIVLVICIIVSGEQKLMLSFLRR